MTTINLKFKKLSDDINFADFSFADFVPRGKYFYVDIKSTDGSNEVIGPFDTKEEGVAFLHYVNDLYLNTHLSKKVEADLLYWAVALSFGLGILVSLLFAKVL